MSSSDAWRELYPFDSHELTIDGARYHYLDEGQGRPVLLVHGNPTWSFYWRNVIRELRGSYRLIAPDHIGCGLSDKPQQYSYRLAQHVKNLVRLVEHLDLQDVTLVGHDWGGAIGMGAAVAMPDRFGQLALFNTAAFRSKSIPLRIRICRTPLLGTLAVQGCNAFARAAMQMATAHPERLTPEIRAGYLAPYDGWHNRIATHRFVTDIPLRAGHPSYQALEKIEHGLAQFREHPVLLAWGMKDWCFTPAFLDRFLEFFPAAEVLRIADAGHLVVEDAPEVIVARLREFLSSYQVAIADDAP